ncbi:hypothetical protein AB0F77_33115 [Streptomyces sp. NPDC026672]|uniref:hypothetical protein n=1 Tax=unclassified Streptomyces TaxID=2593676 RepID=UPI0033E2FF8A
MTEPGARPAVFSRGWTTVCFPGPGCRGDRLGGAGDGPWGAGAGPWGGVGVEWWSPTGRGLAVVRAGTPSGPAGCCPVPCPRLPCDTHLWAEADAPHGSPVSPPVERADVVCANMESANMESADVVCADVVCGRGPSSVRDLLARHPGCLVAAAPAPGGAVAVGVRGGAGGPWCGAVRRGGAVSVRVVASVTHAWLAAGRHPGTLLSVTPVPGPVTVP